MEEYKNNHYVQKKLLNNFATKAENGKFKINIIDLKEKTVQKRNTEHAFSAQNLYDVHDEDIKKLEKDLNTKIETPFNNILTRYVEEEYDTFTITRAELETIKKYLLIQQYRSLKNSTSYNEQCDKDSVLSRYNIQQGETQLDFWKREMQTILDNSLDDIIFKLNLVGVKQKTMNIFTGFLMFVHTSDEFVINDLGYVTERSPVNIKMSPEEYGKITETMGKTLYGADGFGKKAKERAENQSEYIDNYMFFPVSNDLGILVVDEMWKQVYLNSLDITKSGILPSPLLSKHFSFPENKYINQKLIKKQSDIQKYKSKNDKYIYKIHELDSAETIFLNNLLMNEAYRYVGYKTKEKIWPSILSYIYQSAMKAEYMKNDYNFMLSPEIKD